MEFTNMQMHEPMGFESPLAIQTTSHSVTKWNTGQKEDVLGGLLIAHSNREETIRICSLLMQTTRNQESRSKLYAGEEQQKLYTTTDYRTTRNYIKHQRLRTALEIIIWLCDWNDGGMTAHGPCSAIQWQSYSERVFKKLLSRRNAALTKGILIPPDRVD